MSGAHTPMSGDMDWAKWNLVDSGRLILDDTVVTKFVWRHSQTGEMDYSFDLPTDVTLNAEDCQALAAFVLPAAAPAKEKK